MTVDATFERYLLDPHGHVRGLLLKDGSLVHAPEAAVRDIWMKAGDALKIEAHAKAVSGVTLYGRALVKKGSVVVVDATEKVDHGKEPKDHGKLAELTVTSTVGYFLYGPKGAVRGARARRRHRGPRGQGGDARRVQAEEGGRGHDHGQGGELRPRACAAARVVKLPNGDVKKP